MDEPFVVYAEAGAEQPGGRLTGLREGTVHVYKPDGNCPQVTLLLSYERGDHYWLDRADAALLGTVLRAHAALAQRALPWQQDEEPSGKPSKVRWRDGDDEGWVQVWTPWPPPEPPQVHLLAGGVTVVLDFAQSVALSQALEDAAAR